MKTDPSIEKKAIQADLAETIHVTDRTIILKFKDGRETRTPLTFYPMLLQATPAQRGDWIKLNDGEGFHWPQLDLDLSVEAILHGKREAVPKPPEAVWKLLEKYQGKARPRATARQPVVKKERRSLVTAEPTAAKPRRRATVR